MSKEDNNGSIDYQKLNDEEIKKYFEDSKIDFNPKVKITDKQFNDNISKLIKPNININSNSYTSEQEYISKVSDPFKRMQQLKAELLKNKNDIDNAISKYNDISTQVDISDINNYSILYSNAQKYKNKVDSFINYDIIKNRLNKKGMDSDSDSEDEDDVDEQKKAEKAKENKAKKEEKKNNILKKREENEKLLKKIEESTSALFRTNFEINSLNEKYSLLTNNLISKLNNIDSDLNLYMKYKVCANPDNTLTTLKNKIIEVENQISKIENIIGDYDFNVHKSTIYGALKNILKLNNDNKDYVKNRFENSRVLDSMIKLFNEDESNKTYLETYKQICESYLLYLSMKKFEDVISYLKKRINAIKSIILNSEQFDFDIKALNELIKKNEGNYEILKYKYLQTLECFSNLEEILKEINNLDVIMKKKI
jgi:hypothetical protein